MDNQSGKNQDEEKVQTSLKVKIVTMIQTPKGPCASADVSGLLKYSVGHN